MTRVAAVLAATAAIVVAGTGAQAFAADGKALFTAKTCIACHGEEGRAPIAPTYPRLAGQNEGYLVNQIKDIRDGRRTDAQSVVMSGVVGSLTDAEVAAIAKYLSGLK